MKRPFKHYHGGKGADGTYQNIINKIVPHDIFISGCLGNCAIMRYKKPAPVMNIGIDINPEVIEAWAEFGHFSYFYYCNDIIEYMQSEIPGLLMKAKRIFIYLDPPFPADTRKSKRKVYKYEMLSREEHIRLLETATGISNQFPQRVFFAISSYPNELYNDYLTDWYTFTYKAKTRRGSVTEILYMNYPEPDALHDYQFLGTDYRDRYRISCRIKRNVERLVKMDALERNAIIQAIRQSDELKFK